MPISVVMPALEMAQETGKLVAWRKKEGDSVAKGETLLEIETDKAVMEIECPGDGILTGIKAQEGAVVPVGQTIAWIVRPGEVPPPEEEPSESRIRTVNRPATPALAESHTPPEPGAAAGKISPKARRLASERGVDISELRGSGPDGAIVAADILAMAGSARLPAGGQLENLSATARLMAQRTTQSWTTVPHFFVVRDVDASALVQARERIASASEPLPVKVTHTDLLIALLARVLEKHPRVNASWTAEGIRMNSEVNIGVAVAVEDGVVAPVIQHASQIKLDEIAALRAELTERAKAGRLRPSDITGATFTLSNLGMYHVDAFTAIINPPQAAILAVGSIRDRVVPVDGKPGIRPMMTITLSCDHRVLDGAHAAAFLNDLVQGIEEPEKYLSAAKG